MVMKLARMVVVRFPVSVPKRSDGRRLAAPSGRAQLLLNRVLSAGLCSRTFLDAGGDRGMSADWGDGQWVDGPGAAAGGLCSGDKVSIPQVHEIAEAWVVILRRNS